MAPRNSDHPATYPGAKEMFLGEIRALHNSIQEEDRRLSPIKAFCLHLHNSACDEKYDEATFVLLFGLG
jgi:hypothetical protein